MDARQANTYDKTSDGCGFSYLYFFSLGAPQNQLDDVRHRIPEYASLSSAIQYGVSTSHFQRNGNASIDHLRAHRANMPVKSLPCSVIFLRNAGILESEIKREFNIHHSFGPDSYSMREWLNTSMGLSLHRLGDFCIDTIKDNICLQLPSSNPFSADPGFVGFDLERKRGDATFPSNMILLILLLELPSSTTSRVLVSQVIGSYSNGRKNRLTTKNDIILFQNATFLNAPVHVQAKYITINEGRKGGIFETCKSLSMNHLSGRLPPRITNMQLMLLDTPSNRQLINRTLDGELCRQELLLIRFLKTRA
jgi:hypothetical protein